MLGLAKESDLIEARNALAALGRANDALRKELADVKADLAVKTADHAETKKLADAAKAVAADAAKAMDKRLADANAAAAKLSRELDEERERNTADVLETNERHAKALADVHLVVQGIEERLSAVRGALAASQTAHEATRGELHIERLAHAETTKRHGALQELHAVVAKERDFHKQDAAQARINEDAVVAALRKPK